MVIALRIRRSLQRQRVFRDRRNPLDCFSDGQLYEAFRFHRTDLLRLFDDLAADVEYVAPRQGSLPVPMQVLLMLSYITLCPQFVPQCMCICRTTLPSTPPPYGCVFVLRASLVHCLAWSFDRDFIQQSKLTSIFVWMDVAWNLEMILSTLRTAAHLLLPVVILLNAGVANFTSINVLI